MRFSSCEALAAARVFSVRCRLRMEHGQPPLVAKVLFDAEGGAWYRIGPTARAGNALLGFLSAAIHPSTPKPSAEDANR